MVFIAHRTWVMEEENALSLATPFRSQCNSGTISFLLLFLGGFNWKLRAILGGWWWNLGLALIRKQPF